METTSTVADDEASTTLGPPDRGTIQVIVGENLFFDERIIERTPDLFTARTGITVEYTSIQYSTILELVNGDRGPGSPAEDVWHLGPMEVPWSGHNGWLYEWDGPKGWDEDDIVPSVLEALSFNGEVYGVPIQAESSFIAYRADVLEAAGLTMPAEPTWHEVAAIARAVHSDDMAGICWPSTPGWDESGAVFTSMLNTFGGTWWTATEDGSIGQSQVNQPAFRETLDFYIDLAADAGPPLPILADSAECQRRYQSGQVAVWYTTTNAATALETEGSAVRGLNGYAPSPTEQTDSSSWMNVTALAIPVNADEAELAKEYLAWASGPDPLDDGDPTLSRPRYSNYDNPSYRDPADDSFHGPYLDTALEALETAPVTDPGLTPRPGINGVQYVSVPEFQDIATRCSERIALALTGETTVDDAQTHCHELADQASP